MNETAEEAASRGNVKFEVCLRVGEAEGGVELNRVLLPAVITRNVSKHTISLEQRPLLVNLRGVAAAGLCGERCGHV